MRHFCNERLHVVRQRIHSRSCRYKGRQFHRKQRIGKNDLRQELGRKEDLLLMGYIVGNDGAPAYLATRAGRCRDGYKMRNIIRNINVTANEIIILE